jgi:hypothetical protein
MDGAPFLVAHFGGTVECRALRVRNKGRRLIAYKAIGPPRISTLIYSVECNLAWQIFQSQICTSNRDDH